MKPLLATVLLVSGALLGSGCESQIGDSCSINVDCSPLGDRICDTTQLEGYCTIPGCDQDTCPDEAICVRFFPTAFLSQTCNPETEDAVVPSVQPTNNCRGDEICLSSGFCAQQTQESRFCMQKCEQDSDCRPGYECRRTATRGAELLRDPDQPDLTQQRFCAQEI